MSLSPDQITRIGKDLTAGRDPDDLGYTGEERRVYQNMKRELEEIRKVNPDARLDVFGNIDGL